MQAKRRCLTAWICSTCIPCMHTLNAFRALPASSDMCLTAPPDAPRPMTLEVERDRQEATIRGGDAVVPCTDTKSTPFTPSYAHVSLVPSRWNEAPRPETRRRREYGGHSYKASSCCSFQRTHA